MISDEVLDAIAGIEMHRQEMQKEAGAAAACNEALRKLHELLEREREALQSHGAGSRHAPHVEALEAEIERVKRLADMLAKGRPGHFQRRKPAGPGQQHNRLHAKGRRTTGRSRGR